MCILKTARLRSCVERMGQEEGQGRAQVCHLTPQWDREKGRGVHTARKGMGGNGHLRFVTCGNCGLVPQVCIRKYKARQFVGSSNFQGPESSENDFSYSR